MLKLTRAILSAVGPGLLGTFVPIWKWGRAAHILQTALLDQRQASLPQQREVGKGRLKMDWGRGKGRPVGGWAKPT